MTRLHSSVADRTTNLLAAATRFVGRGDDLRCLQAAVATGERLVSVMGPAGMGKTRLLRHFGALSAAEAFPGGIWFCELAEARTLEELCAVVASSCTIALAPGASEAELVERIGDALGQLGRALIVLDNFEQLAPLSGESVALWHAHASQAVFLVSTRDRLQLPGELVHELAPLQLTAALELLSARAASAGRGGDIEADVATEIVERLDRIPLAIELAAARLAILSPPQLLQRLDKRFDLLNAKHRTGTARHHTLWGAIDWSWQLLAPHERRTLAVVSVFRGGFTLDAAEVVLDALPGDVLEMLETLRDRSLVRVYAPSEMPGDLRLGLYETIRAFAAERLASYADGGGGWRDAHLAWALAHGEAHAALVHGHRGDEARRALSLERDNLLAAFEHASRRGDTASACRLVLALDSVLAARGPFQRHRELLDRVVGGELSAPLRARALLARGSWRRRSGELAEARRDLEAALVCSAEGGSPATSLEADIVSHLGIATHEAGDLDTAGAHYERALDIARRRGDARCEGRALGSLAIVHHERGRFEDAQTHYEWALRLLRRVGDARSEAVFLCNLGDLHYEQGRLGEAQRHYERARCSLDEIGDQRLVGVVVGNLGAVLQEQGALDAALERRREAVRTLAAAGDRRLAAVFQGYVGEVLHERGDLAGADLAYGVAVDVLDRLGDRRYVALFLGGRAAAAVERGASSSSVGDWERAEALVAALDDELLGVALTTHRGQLALRRGDAASVRDAVRAARRVAASSDAVRFALRRLEAAMARAGLAGTGPEAKGDPLRVARDGRGFQAPGGDPVDLTRRRALRLILAKLGQQREQHVGESLSLDELLQAGWPGERVRPEAGANRVYVALATLRRMGLRQVLLSRDDGYLLDPTVSLELYPD